MSKDFKAELRLFGHAIVVFLSHMLMCTIEVAIYISTITGIDSIRAFAMPQYPWANDVLNLISGPALLIISANTRRDYMRFLNLGRFGLVGESTVMHVTTIRSDKKTMTEKQFSLPARMVH
uniref:Serpentine receptor class gamma n=1 Tax=Panagrellus redivivus TaxID=6233 RepID=A0A7E4VPZ3_PANRE